MAQNLLASPPAAAGNSSTSNAHNVSVSSTASPQTAAKQSSPNQQRLAVLRVKRQELEKRLQEKNSLLQELGRREAHLIGVYPTVTVAGQEGHHNPSSSADDIGGLLKASGSSGHGHNTHSLPRKIGTGFTLSEKYLNKRTLSSPLTAPLAQQQTEQDEEELNNLLLQRDIQQQICKASLKLLNDAALTKSVRRKHKQSYEYAQQKLQEIGNGLTTIQHQHQQKKTTKDGHHTLPLTIKTTTNTTTNFKVPQQQQYAGESPVLQHQKRNRHDSYSNAAAHHSPGYPGTSSSNGNPTGGDHKGLYRSSSNSSSLNNSNVLGKSSLSLDNPMLHQQPHHPQQQQQNQSYGHHLSVGGQSKPLSYESKSLHNFVMSSSNASSYQSPHHHPALLSPTFYHPPNGGGFAVASRTSTHHYPSNSSSLRQSHQQQQQFMSPPPQQVIIPQSGLGGYWTLNEHNERVWCASSAFSPEPSANSGQQPPPPPQGVRHATTLDRKAAIYVPSTSQAAGHGKMKMPSPETSPQAHSSAAASHHNHLNHQSQQGVGGGGYGVHHPDGGKSFSIPNKSTSMGNIEYVSHSRGGGATGAEDTASLGSFNSDTNNNSSVYHQNPPSHPHPHHHHHLVSAMAAVKVSHYHQSHPMDATNNNNGAGVDQEDDDNEELADNANNNQQQQQQQQQHPPPLRPKSSASQHAPERSWYETSLDKVVAGSKMASTTGRHKPPALLPRNEMSSQPQLHIDIPTSPLAHHQTNQHNHQQQQLERSMSHRIVGSVNFVAVVSPAAAAAAALPLPPITRQHPMSAGQHHPHLPEDATAALHSPGVTSVGGMPMSPHKKLSSRSQSVAGQQQQQSSSLLSPRLVANGQHQQQMASGGTPLQSPVVADKGGRVVGALNEEEIQVESPKNMTVVQQGKFQPYKEESKPFEMSDFYKYSTKFRQQGVSGGGGGGGLSSGSNNTTSRRVANSSRSGNTDESSYRGNVLYQQEQQRGVYSDLADVANNNNGHNLQQQQQHNAHQQHSKNNNNNSSNNNVSMYNDRSGASNATTAAANSGAREQYPISYQQ